MKSARLIINWILIITLSISIALPAYAENSNEESGIITSGVYTFQIEKGEASLIEISLDAKGAVTIPSSVNGYPVTKISSIAKLRREKGDNTADNLSSIVVPDSVREIESSAFDACSAGSIDLGNNITRIGSYAFGRCKFETIQIPDSVESIGTEAFWDCKNLKELVIPKNVSSITCGLCGLCDHLTKIQVAPENKFFKAISGVLFSKDGKTLVSFPGSITRFTVPEGTTKIAIQAGNAVGLRELELPDTLLSIEDFALEGNDLRKVTVPGSIGTLKDLVFAYNKSLTTVILKDGLSAIGEGNNRQESPFTQCTRLKYLYIPSSVTYIDHQFFTDLVVINNHNSIFNEELLYPHVYYGGSESQWNDLVRVETASSVRKEALSYMTVHFNSKISDVPDAEEDETGNKETEPEKQEDAGQYKTDHPGQSRYPLKLEDGTVIDPLEALIKGSRTQYNDPDFGVVNDTASWYYGYFSKAVDKNKSYVIPGLSQTNLTGNKTSTNMVPQGVCQTSDYLLISAYDSAGAGNAVIYVLNRKNGNYLTTLVIQNSVGCHVGGLAYVYDSKDGGCVFVADSGKNSKNKCIRKISVKTIRDAVGENADAVTVEAKNVLSIDDSENLKPSFLSYYGGYLYVGKCQTDDILGELTENAKLSKNYVVGYPVKDQTILESGKTPVIKLVGISQGVHFTEYKGKMIMVSSNSYGRYNESELRFATVVTAQSNSEGIPWIRTDKAQDQGSITVPNMTEDINIDPTSGELKICFESGAKKYQTAGDTRLISKKKRRRALDYVISTNLPKLISSMMRTGALTLQAAEDGDESDVLDSGMCGEFVGYTLYSDGLLQIGGQGAMYDYTNQQTPWYGYRDKIREVGIGADVTAVGDYAFRDCSKIEEVTVASLSNPNEALSVGHHAFASCASLKTVLLPDKPYDIASDAFDPSNTVTVCGTEDTVRDVVSQAKVQTHVHEYKLSKTVKATENQLYDYDEYVCSCGDTVIRNAAEMSEVKKFKDVENPSWYSDSVDYVAAKGYMAGVSDTRFNPTGKVTRGMITQVLYAMEGKPSVPKRAGFKDVAAGKWYADSVDWAASVGLVAGYSKDKFGPEDAITREQMAAIMYQYARYKKYDAAENGDISKYKDTGSVSKYAVGPMKWAVGHGIISGTNIGLEPKQTASRAQIAVILRAFDKNVRR